MRVEHGRYRLLIAWLAAFGSACGAPAQHGSVTDLSQASTRDWNACEHQVPAEVCVRCVPARAARFKRAGDWCREHSLPESQCLKCHPDLDFSPPEAPPAEADVKQIVERGEDLPALERHLAKGKVTIFDFHANWCPPCRKLDEHLYPTLASRQDLALRKVNVVSWDSPVAERYLREVPELPLVIVFDKHGKRIGEVFGAKLELVDKLIDKASQ
jgi:thiol-disulfide isomerase/thioredoxin